jgi:hypothetical protein
MKVYLLHRDQDIDLERELPPNHEALSQDLELETLTRAMAAGDEFLLDVARRVVLAGGRDPDTILYRQGVLADCVEQSLIVQQMYDIAADAITTERKVWYGLLFRDSPDVVLRRSAQMLELLVGNLKQLRQLAEQHADGFHSEGFVRFLAMLVDELGDDYFATVEEHLKELRFRRGVLISAVLGTGNKGVHHVLRRLPHWSWRERLTGADRQGYSFLLADRDEAGARALTELEGRGITPVANALARSADHILNFFHMLRAELAFYLGCLHLRERLVEKGEPVCFPEPLPPEATSLSARGLYDVCLSLNLEGRAVGNDIDADGTTLVMITGANQGGKSTFLRSVGVAQLMMQSGMFVPAESLRANVCGGVFTHFKREEDATMARGKLDEELARMSEIADLIGPQDLLLCNESFGSTNEREGSEIARQVVRAMTEAGVKVVYVTHLYDLAHGLYRQRLDHALFLRAERMPDGRRTFLLREGEPRPTSHGEDSYRRVFGLPIDSALAAGTTVSGG